MERMKRVVSFLLCFVMVVGLLPMSAFAADADDSLTAALTEAKTYIDAITVNNSSNDPETVVKNFKTHFTWDNEKRESSKSYLFDWSYYNGVVFEGLEYLYEVSGDETYKDYVVEYMSSLIDSDGTWAKCTNNSSKECAGYNSTHGADCYKTASLLLDAYEMTGDDRYLTMAQTLYADLDSAAKSYSLSNAGNNYRHTWASDPSPDLWLDGLYMILPFCAEYAAYTGDTEELDLIVDRMQWVSDNMYNESKGLFYHAADSASSNSGTYWLRSIGWYAAAIVDVMDSMEGENLEAMKKQLVKLVDGMKAVQNSSNGMWLNNMAASQSSSNPYETSGTALVCYAVMKAVNNGWLDESYADMAILAFKGICNEKLNGTTLTDICFKGAPGSSNSTFYDNEGKGVGPFIMFYAEVLEYVNAGEEEVPETTVPAETEPEVVVKEDNGVTVSAPGITGLTVETVAVEDVAEAVAEVLTGTLVAYDITVADFVEGSTAAVTVNIPEGVDAAKFGVYYVPTEGEPELMNGEAAEDGKTYTFYTNHFSTYVGGEVAVAAETGSVSGTGYLPGGTRYVLDTDGVDAGIPYLIVSANSGNASALRNNNGNRAGQSVTVSNRVATISSNESTSIWTFTASGSNWYISNGNQRIRLSNDDILNNSGQALTVSNQGNGTYRIAGNDRYLRYSGTNWERSRTQSNVYLFKQETTNGAEVTFTVTPGSATIQPNGTVALTGTVTVAGETVDVSDCTITWESSNEDYATVSNGTVTGVADGTVNITATLSEVDGTALQEDIVLTIPVTVQSRKATSVTIDTLVGNVVRGSAAAVGTGAFLTVTYEDGFTEKIEVTLAMLTGDYDNATTEGTYTGLGIASYAGIAVEYEGEEVGNRFTLNVNPKAGNNYPEYPDSGAVDVNKYLADTKQFQNTGVANVELTTSGIPVQTGVDAVLTIDISNSMAWATGTTSADGYASYNKLDEVMAAVKTFANILLAPNEDGTPTNNTITIVTFAGYDAEHWNGSGTYIDSVRTLVTASSSIDVIEAIADGTQFTSADGLTISYIPESRNQNDADNVEGESGTNRGDTNYDYAFWQTAKAITDGGLGGEDREIHVLFMTDGCASNFNDYYYRSSNVGYYYRPGTQTAYTYYAASNGTAWTNYIKNTLIANNGGNIYAKEVYEMVTGMYGIGFDMAHGSFAGLTTWDSSVNWEDVFNEIVSKVVVDEEGNGLIPVTAASDTETLNNFYESMAREIRYAATNAYFVDQMGDDFDIQRSSYVTKFKGTAQESFIALNPVPQISVSSSKVYSRNDIGTTIDGVTVTEQMVGQSYGNSSVIETVVFNAEGTEAYSSVDGYNTTNKILTQQDGERVTVVDHTGTNIMDAATKVIAANTFWYNANTTAQMIDTDGDGVAEYSLAPETFYWNIGTINETEYVLNYAVYLEGAAEGNATEGTYDTNEFANLYYTNWLGNSAVKYTTSPKLTWGGAQVSYGFYLVDENGNPVTNQTTGATGSFYDAVKVTRATLYQSVNLNSTATVDDIVAIASQLRPDGYELYDEAATYTIAVDSGNTLGGWQITSGESVHTTYVTDFSGSLASNELNVTDDEYDYSATTVWFAVKWIVGTVPDVVVIDFGLPVDITVLGNDMFGENGKLIGIGDIEDKPAAEYTSSDSAAFDASLGLVYGTAEIKEGTGGAATSEGSKVRYTPSSMEMPTYDRFSYEVEYNKTEENGTTTKQYYYGDVTVIPATTIYYEDNFVDLSSYTWGSNGWVEVEEGNDKWVWSPEGTYAGGTQDEDRPDEYNLPHMDANNLYGYDSAYTNMSEYSMGSALKAHVDYDNMGVATFDFWGTGFDVVGLTSNKTGTLIVNVYNYQADGEYSTEDLAFVWTKDAEGKDVKDYYSFAVDTYYGYAYELCNVTYVYENVGTDEDPDYEWVVSAVAPAPEGAAATPDEDFVFPADDADGSEITFTRMRWIPVDSNSPNALYQVPVMEVADMAYGRYHAEIKATYEPIFDHEQYDDASFDLYIDAIRIYDPAGDSAEDIDDVIKDAYIKDHELFPDYYEPRNWLISAAAYHQAQATDVIDGIVFIDSDVATNVVADYENYGPNNELYLAPGQAVNFILVPQKTAPEGYEVDTVQIQFKSVGGTAYGKIWSVTDGGTEAATAARTVSTATDMYFDITNLNGDNVVIKNPGVEGNAILSVTNVKVTYKAKPADEDDGEAGTDSKSTGGIQLAGASLNNALVTIDPVESDVSVLSDNAAETAVETAAVPFTVTVEGVRAALLSMNSVDAEEPGVTEPETTEPEETEPETTEPEETEPEVTEPEETEPETSEPEETEPEVTDPDDSKYDSVIGRLIGWLIGLIGKIFG